MAKMQLRFYPYIRKNRWRPVLCPVPRWGSLRRCPRPAL